MERLTDCAQGYCEVYCDHYTSCFSEPDICERKHEVQLYERLKDYESTGLEPDAVMNMAESTETACLTWFVSRYGIPAGRMMGFAEADAEGRLVVLPFLPNEDVWDYSEFFDGTPYAEYYKLRDSFVGVGVSANGKRVFEYDCFTIDPEQIGKTIFLSREEAEAALKGVNHES